MVAFNIHGFSITYWHEVIDHSKVEETFFKAPPQGIRSDDWALDLPMIFSQLSHRPPFPVINRNIGTGMNMLLPIKAPVLYPTLLFQPGLWGFFVGPAVGMSW